MIFSKVYPHRFSAPFPLTTTYVHRKSEIEPFSNEKTNSGEITFSADTEHAKEITHIQDINLQANHDSKKILQWFSIAVDAILKSTSNSIQLKTFELFSHLKGVLI